ncbi:MAG TPA: ATP phosphoribosyltransferase regulatory subunit [Accumulibacter sp.]|uniref:ATP phosphoribosyltransferase regulatory subunit n=1 Tax=Accumulibacter sp. TaxID=2053492 RepID=UPI0028799C93|nr:ATP phosphoribosyltransferase regulatory subunit [Accumulibacter sp.]HNI00356.1 ATP phosphoribosyltransferase regulatory subunit [Rhodocyclaceae bacterium]MDS4053936.1 ATP phosphoribosyltransferase regulatory subunit [Accumulibacter sp.]HMV06395.1 ATP phosphoribosyltransferase regulatory subunit [Accumulibacter sp.]HMW64732.1 ATP phosphoribosyltransferase regulatory subunit [Accumulibacter sp.]HMW81804.1 ATP phosphoribosyltransferase regulatory subunit [Accumulibacter sp.]
MNWLLPEHIADVLPAEAAQIERLRRMLLDQFQVHGYELVMPPLLEHLDSLLTGSGQDLKLRTFKLVDQLSGRTLGVRADITPQVARIDAHLLNRSGVTRLCYCGSVLHTLPAALTASREPIQIGAELYGYAGLAADREVIRLMADALGGTGIAAARIDLGHVGVFRSLVVAAGLDSEMETNLLQLLQGKDAAGLRECCRELVEPYRSALIALPDLYGGAETLDAAARWLPALPAVVAALHDLRALDESLPEVPLSFDLADLRGYRYHNGVFFAAYHAGISSALALGGRYDGVGRIFGRERPATGFSLDLREIARLVERSPAGSAIMAPCATGDQGLTETIAVLRKQGETVIELLPGETLSAATPSDRRLVKYDGKWRIEHVNRNG